MKLKRCSLAFLSLIIPMLWIGCNGDASPERSATPTVSPTPTITTDDKGNSINPEGWKLPVTMPEKKERSTRIGKYQDERTIRVDVVSYSVKTDKEHRIIFEGPYRPGGQASVITHVDELSVGGGKVFCFIYWFSPFTNEGLGDEIGVTSAYKFCDMDGDGKYELKRNGFGMPIVPNWAK